MDGSSRKLLISNGILTELQIVLGMPDIRSFFGGKENQNAISSQERPKQKGSVSMVQFHMDNNIILTLITLELIYRMQTEKPKQNSRSQQTVFLTKLNCVY